MGLAGLLFCILSALAALAQEQAGYLPDSILYPGTKPGIILVVDKNMQELRIYSHDGQGGVVLEKVIPCSTGMVRGDKLVRGDKKTPNGYYIFNQKLLPSELPEIYGILAYPMDYPNFWDKNIGRKGDGIWTHGVNKPLMDFDSVGCVELLNHDLAALEDVINLYDTPILLYEEVRYVSSEELVRDARAVRNFVEDWRYAWASKDLDTYARMYDRNFYNNDGMSYEAWMNHKRNVAAGYKKIDIRLDDMRIYRHRDVVVVSFIQRYQGDGRYSSVGAKRLYLKESGSSFFIVAEEFIGNPQPPTNKRLTPEEKYAALTTPPLSVATFSQPVVTASAGAINPASDVFLAAAAPSAVSDAAQDEQARADLEARFRTGAPTPDQVPPEDSPPVLTAESQGTDNFSSSVTGQLTQGYPPSTSEPEATQAGELSLAAVQPNSSTDAYGTGVPAADPALTSDASLEAGEDYSGQASTSTTTGELAAAAMPGQTVSPTPETGGSELTALIAAWEIAWEAKDEDSFFSFYDESFRFLDKGMDLKGFKGYRGRLMRKATTIEVGISDLKVSLDGNKATATFTQNYRSDNYRDTGVKTLTFAKDLGSWKITSEAFKATS
jgi:murein L,D-transpeptidase YafK